jgi:hypothetical protein
MTLAADLNNADRNTGGDNEINTGANVSANIVNFANNNFRDVLGR